MYERTMYFANLAWTEVEDLLASDRTPVLLFPVGATEPHGPHSPLSTDVIISMGICRRVAMQLADDPNIRAVILPHLDFGVTRCTRSFPGPIHISEDTLNALIVDVCTSLIEQGFAYIVIVNNHFEPEHVQTLHRSIDDVQSQTGVTVGYMDLTRKERAVRLTEEFKKAECHAGRYETSLVLADEPALVNSDIMQTLPYVPINLATVLSEGTRDFKEMGLTQSYNGSPAEATTAEGEEVYSILTGMMIDLIRDLVRGTGGRDAPGLYARIES